MENPKKIAIIFASCIYDQKGLFNAVHNRVRYLKQIANYQIDVYLLSTYKGLLISLITKEKRKTRLNEYEKDGITYHILWRKNSIIDYVLYHKLHCKEFFHTKYDKRIASLFSDYDLLDIHSGAGNIALEVKRQFGIPYIASWHGSDIHTSPNNSKSQRLKTKCLLENASCNCFVSKGLKEAAKMITEDFNYDILYNGANDLFYKYTTNKRDELRKEFKVNEKKVVAFIGNVINVKNPLVLPEIFNLVKEQYKNNVQFWIIGDGDLRSPLEENLKNKNLDYIAWGNQAIEKIPVFLQCVDVVVLPSYREGFGMVLVEAIKCGANAVASKVDGTVEILGEDDTFELNESFAEKISSRIVFYLNNNTEQQLDPRFSWENTAKLENKIIEDALF